MSTVAVAVGVNSNQVRGFLAAWGGWALDGMDGSIYGLVLVPALTELLPRSGIQATPGNIGYYGSILLALFLFGWGLSMIWGPISDRVGRVRALMLTILCYSLFTFLCGFATTIWQLAALRVLCGLGIGGEQPVGAAYIAESLSEDQRKIGAGLMHTGYYFGFFAAAVINYFVGAQYGWRVMFMVGGLPALLIGFIRYGVNESPAWQRRADLVRSAASNRPRMRDAFTALFSPALRTRTLVMSILFLISILGFWGGSTYVPAAVTQIAMRGGMTAPDAARMASYGSMLLAAGTIIGCVIIPFVAEQIGRRWTTALFFLITMVTIAATFGYVFYMRDGALPLFLALLFFLGIGGANVAIYTIWLPEQFPTDCRASAIAFISSSGRFVAVAMVFIVGAGIASYGSIGVPVASMALLYLLGIVLLPLTEETRGRTLPV